MASSDLVAKWDVTLSDKVHRIEFEHGTTTGKRVIRVDGNVCELHYILSLLCFSVHYDLERHESRISSLSIFLQMDICTFFVLISYRFVS